MDCDYTFERHLERACALLLKGTALVALATGAAPALAQSYLSKDELRQLIQGNTVHTEDLASGRAFMAYHDPGGRWQLMRQDGSIVEGVWSIRADGAQCVIMDAETCGLVQKNADGTYTRVVNGTPRNRWSKVTQGKGF
jgi:hypothetical protein